MPKVFVTGDTHGDIDIHKLTTGVFPEQQELTKDDLVIVCGDWGGIWNNAGSDRYVQNWWKAKNFTCCWLDGNHENFELLSKYPVEVWNRGRIHRIADNIIHLMRGQVYEIGGKSFYVMGGAISTDKAWRTPGKSWWPQEEPSFAEEQEGFLNLQAHGDKVDFILTHEGPASVVAQIYAREGRTYVPDHISRSFDATAQAVKFDHWFFAHHHTDITHGRYTCCYQKVYEIQPDGQIAEC